jgi:hypothetical protein
MNVHDGEVDPGVGRTTNRDAEEISKDKEVLDCEKVRKSLF